MSRAGNFQHFSIAECRTPATFGISQLLNVGRRQLSALLVSRMSRVDNFQHFSSPERRAPATFVTSRLLNVTPRQLSSLLARRISEVKSGIKRESAIRNGVVRLIGPGEVSPGEPPEI